MSATQAPDPARLERLSYFFPAHNEEANLEGLVAEALDALPALAEAFEIIAVDDGSSDGTPAPRGRPRRRPPRPRPGRPPSDEPRLWRGTSVRLRGLPLRPRRVHRRRPPVQGRRSRSPDRHGWLLRTPGRRGRVPDQARRPAHPTLYARAYRLANRIFFGLKVTDVDCACKLFRREALEGVRVESGGAFFSAELLIKLRAAAGPSWRSACRTTRGPPALRPARSPA